MLSGVKPTGSPHIGNYFGAMRQFVQLQDKFEKVFVFIADYHALNFIKDAELMRENIFNLAVDYLALGLDPKRVIFYQQSKIPAHTELAWIFNTLTSLGYLKRAHVYKDAKEKGKENELSIGDFNYPILMASDILLYDADVVPVGKDQKQHLEMTRDIAEKFNSTFKIEIFKLPEPYILSDTEVVPGTDGRKMSKSYGNTIPLFAEKDEIAKTVMKIVTDSEGEIPVNVYNIHKLLLPQEKLDKIYSEHRGQYKLLKEALIEDLENFIAPMREKRKEILQNKEFVYKTLEEGATVARELANKKIVEVRKAIGVCLDTRS